MKELKEKREVCACEKENNKLSEGDDTKWYQYVPKLQRILNSRVTRSTKH